MHRIVDYLLSLFGQVLRRVSGFIGLRLFGYAGPSGRGGGPPPDPLNAPLVQLGPVDALSANACAEGILVMGATGSGKTSGSGATILRSFLAANLGGLVLCAKPGEYEFIRTLARQAGRESDVIRFAPDERWRFNPLEFELTRTTRGAGLTGNITALLLEAMECGGRGKNTGGGDSYWKDALTELVMNAVHLAGFSGTMRLADLLAIIRSAPRTIEDVRAEDCPWRRESFCFQKLLEASRTLVTEADRLDYDETEAYWLSAFPELASKTRSIIVSSFTALCGPMLRSPMRELFCTETNITPQACERGAIIVLDLPVKLFGPIGAFAQVLWKMSFQKTMEQRDTNKSPVPVFLWADECQFFVSSHDQNFLSTARSARVCTVYLTQNLPSLYDALGRDHSVHDKVDALLGNLTTKIWHANGDPTTNRHAADTIAQVYQFRTGASTGRGSSMSQSGGAPPDVVSNEGLNENQGQSVNEQLGYAVLPQEFTTLRTGGAHNNFLVDGIIFKPGRVFNATDTNYMRVTFKQS